MRGRCWWETAPPASSICCLQQWDEGPLRIAAPAFGEYENAGLLAGCPIEYVTPETGPPWRCSQSALLEMTKPGARTVWIANPANPTGQLIPKDLLLEIVQRVEGSDLFIVLDEAFIEFAPEHSLVAEAPRFRNLMVLRSLTKMYALPGLRLGWMVAHTRLDKGVGSAAGTMGGQCVGPRGRFLLSRAGCLCSKYHRFDRGRAESALAAI